MSIFWFDVIITSYQKAVKWLNLLIFGGAKFAYKFSFQVICQVLWSYDIWNRSAGGHSTVPVLWNPKKPSGNRVEVLQNIKSANIQCWWIERLSASVYHFNFIIFLYHWLHPKISKGNQDLSSDKKKQHFFPANNSYAFHNKY